MWNIELSPLLGTQDTYPGKDTSQREIPHNGASEFHPGGMMLGKPPLHSDSD